MSDQAAETPMKDHVSTLLRAMRNGSHMTVTESDAARTTHNIPAEVGKALAQQHADLIDKAENVLIAHGMGWDLKGVLEELAKVTPLSGEAKAVRNPEPITTPETIVAAAVQIEGLTISLPRPAGHGEVLALMSFMPGYNPGIAGDMQGFVTSEGRFVTRVEALKIAHRAGQKFRTPPRPPNLFSEDLW